MGMKINTLIFFFSVHIKVNLSLFFRQVKPSATNHAVNMLSDEVKLRNMKKVKVNAQITFIIYILESVANFSILVAWTLVVHKSNDLPRMLSILWYHLFLPYTFLMNTSHNKNLVVDDGWVTTIQNTLILPIPANSLHFNHIASWFRRFKGFNENIVKPNEEINSESLSPDSSIGMKHHPSRQNIASEENTTLEIPSISRSVEVANRLNNENTLNVPDDVQNKIRQW